MPETHPSGAFAISVLGTMPKAANLFRIRPRPCDVHFLKIYIVALPTKPLRLRVNTKQRVPNGSPWNGNQIVHSWLHQVESLTVYVLEMRITSGRYSFSSGRGRTRRGDGGQAARRRDRWRRSRRRGRARRRSRPNPCCWLLAACRCRLLAGIWRGHSGRAARGRERWRQDRRRGRARRRGRRGDSGRAVRRRDRWRRGRRRGRARRRGRRSPSRWMLVARQRRLLAGIWGALACEAAQPLLAEPLAGGQSPCWRGHGFSARQAPLENPRRAGGAHQEHDRAQHDAYMKRVVARQM
mmetsp:Transcript_106150/g.277221  ORF Transcript_106150/g.277221 Transcript_106150/m.277221 type:complete len:296 (-) Transcript_106150:42-929(-)